MKKVAIIILTIQLLSCSVQAVQVAFFIESEQSSAALEGPVSHVAISYKGKWLHSHPSRINGSLTSFPGVHLINNLTDLGFNYVIFESIVIPDPSSDYYENAKKMSFNMFAGWDSKTETHCSILSGKYLMQFLDSLNPSKMKFKSSIWKHHPEAQKMRGKLGMSPKDIFESVSSDPKFELLYKSPLSTFKFKARKLKCSLII